MAKYSAGKAYSHAAENFNPSTILKKIEGNAGEAQGYNREKAIFEIAQYALRDKPFVLGAFNLYFRPIIFIADYDDPDAATEHPSVRLNAPQAKRTAFRLKAWIEDAPEMQTHDGQRLAKMLSKDGMLSDPDKKKARRRAAPSVSRMLKGVEEEGVLPEDEEDDTLTDLVDGLPATGLQGLNYDD